MSTSVLKALPGKLDIKIHSPSILYLSYLGKIMMDHIFCHHFHHSKYWIFAMCTRKKSVPRDEAEITISW